MRDVRSVFCRMVAGVFLASSAWAAEWKILEPAAAPRAYAIAALEFQNMYQAVTGTRLAIISVPDDANLVVIGSDSVNSFCRTAIEQAIIPPLGVGAETDNYRLKSAEKDGRSYLFLAGGSGRSTLYAVYASFPERCNYAGSVIPKVSMILRWMGLDSV